MLQTETIQSFLLKDLFAKQKDYLDYFFQEMNLEHLQKILEKIIASEGVLIFTGVGKSGIIAQKIAQTLLSTGTKSIYIPPTDALHGDIGIVSKKDVVFFLSKSGETKELLNLVPYIRKKEAMLVGVLSHKKAPLAKLCDEVVFLPVKRELCPFNLAPTTSTTVQLIFGDLMAMALMKAKQFSLDEYAKNHPAGAIGKKISLRVEDLMIQGDDIPICRSDDSLLDILCILSEKKCGCLLVVDTHKKLLGIFTDGDLRRSLEKHGTDVFSQAISKLMTAKPKSVQSKSLAWDALKQMEEDPKRLITVLPVLENNQVKGLLRMHDILQSGLN